jgi:hypothetical protein
MGVPAAGQPAAPQCRPPTVSSPTVLRTAGPVSRRSCLHSRGHGERSRNSEPALSRFARHCRGTRVLRGFRHRRDDSISWISMSVRSRGSCRLTYGRSVHLPGVPKRRRQSHGVKAYTHALPLSSHKEAIGGGGSRRAKADQNAGEHGSTGWSDQGPRYFDRAGDDYRRPELGSGVEAPDFRTVGERGDCSCGINDRGGSHAR